MARPRLNYVPPDRLDELAADTPEPLEELIEAETFARLAALASLSLARPAAVRRPLARLTPRRLDL